MNKYEFQTITWKRDGYNNQTYRTIYSNRHKEYFIQYKFDTDEKEKWYFIGTYKRLCNALKEMKSLGYSE